MSRLAYPGQHELEALDCSLQTVLGKAIYIFSRLDRLLMQSLACCQRIIRTLAFSIGPIFEVMQFDRQFLQCLVLDFVCPHL